MLYCKCSSFDTLLPLSPFYYKWFIFHTLLPHSMFNCKCPSINTLLLHSIFHCKCFSFHNLLPLLMFYCKCLRSQKPYFIATLYVSLWMLHHCHTWCFITNFSLQMFLLCHTKWFITNAPFLPHFMFHYTCSIFATLCVITNAPASSLYVS